MMVENRAGVAELKADARQKRYNGFSCPQEGLDEEFARQVAVKFARKCLRRFLDRFAGLLESQAEGLKDFLEGWLEQDSSFEEAWSPFFGALHEALLQQGEPEADDILGRAGSLGLHLMAAGYEGAWSLYFESPVRLRFDRVLLPATDWLKVTAGADQARLELAGNCTLQLIKSGLTWVYEGTKAVVLPQLMMGGRPVTFLPAAIFDCQEAALFETVTPALEDITTTLQMFEQAKAIIAESCPEYLEWIGRVIRGIVPVETLGEARCSGSDTYRPGLIYISTDESPIYLAEAMIHEATHQYMFLLTRLGPLENGADPTLYYSPVKQRNRPIGAIALAYHAFANVLFFYRGCVAQGLEDDEYLQEHRERVVEQLADLEKALRTSTGLSPQGRAIWEPLAVRI
jgi:HEXXH motif-containing protein